MALGARAGQHLGDEVARAICVSFSGRGVGAGLSAACASYLSSRGERWGAPPGGAGSRMSKAMKQAELGEDTGADDRRALESGGTASHESDEDLLHFCRGFGGFRTWLIAELRMSKY